jgi:hypothetical protein
LLECLPGFDQPLDVELASSSELIHEPGRDSRLLQLPDPRRYRPLAFLA